MYVCICNGLTDRDFRHAAQQGARTVAAAFRTLGEKPQCGCCLSCARQVMEEAKKRGEDAACAVAAE